MDIKNANIVNNMNHINTSLLPYDAIIHKNSPTSKRKTPSILSPYLTKQQNQNMSLSSENHLINKSNNESSSSSSHDYKPSLTINTNETDKHIGNGYMHKGSFSTTNNGYISQIGLTKSALISNLSSNLTKPKLWYLNSPIKSVTNRTSSASTIININNSNKIFFPDYGINANVSAPNSTPIFLNSKIQYIKGTKSMIMPDTNKLSLSLVKSDTQHSPSSPLNHLFHNLDENMKNSMHKHQQNNENIQNSKNNLTESNYSDSQSSNTSNILPNPIQFTKPVKASQSLTPIIANRKLNNTPIPNHEPTKCSVKRNGIVKAYAANTNQGIVRNYNEDRVAIILNIMKPASRVNETWPKCSFFGVYDGHGGVNCADFLRDNLHQYVIKESSFPSNPKEALLKGFETAEKDFLSSAENISGVEYDRSGSCAIVVLIVGDTCYVANVGDSRAVLSSEGGTRTIPLSRDHKPIDELEQKRIIEAGGKIYQTHVPALKVADQSLLKTQMQFLVGPHRVLPGRLSVSRTFGDIEAKLAKYGGNPNVVIAVPDIKMFKITAEHDFVILASDGIFDKLSSREVIKCIWESTAEKAPTIHQQSSLGVESILREAISRRTLDNITVVMIAFKNFKEKLFPNKDSQKKKMNTEEGDKSQAILTSPNHLSADGLKLSKCLENKDEQENKFHSDIISQGLGNSSSLKKVSLFDSKSIQRNSLAEFKKSYKDKLLFCNYDNSTNTLTGKQNSFHERTETFGLSPTLKTSLISKTPTNSKLKLFELTSKFTANEMTSQAQLQK